MQEETVVEYYAKLIDGLKQAIETMGTGPHAPSVTPVYLLLRELAKLHSTSSVTTLLDKATKWSASESYGETKKLIDNLRDTLRLLNDRRYIRNNTHIGWLPLSDTPKSWEGRPVWVYAANKQHNYSLGIHTLSTKLRERTDVSSLWVKLIEEPSAPFLGDTSCFPI